MKSKIIAALCVVASATEGTIRAADETTKKNWAVVVSGILYKADRSPAAGHVVAMGFSKRKGWVTSTTDKDGLFQLVKYPSTAVQTATLWLESEDDAGIMKPRIVQASAGQTSIQRQIASTFKVTQKPGCLETLK